ncbi:MAG: hypothetical protein WDM79_10525 [Terricaulis sp.]
MLAVLDWELSTLGDPLGDFTYHLMNWVMPPDGRAGLAGLDLKALGIPTLDDYVALYCAQTGRDGIAALDWYIRLQRLSPRRHPPRHRRPHPPTAPPPAPTPKTWSPASNHSRRRLTVSRKRRDFREHTHLQSRDQSLCVAG